MIRADTRARASAMRAMRCELGSCLEAARWIRGVDGVLDVSSTPGRLFFLLRLRAGTRRMPSAVALEALSLVEVLPHLLRGQSEPLSYGGSNILVSTLRV